MTQGIGEEAVSPGGGGTVGYIDGNHRLWYPPHPSHLLKVPGEIILGEGRRLSIGIPQYFEGMSEVGAVD